MAMLLGIIPAKRGAQMAINTTSIQCEPTEPSHAWRWPAYTVRLGKMAQHARLWALFMAKLKGQSQNASNMPLGKCIGLQHIQISAS